jgi:Cytochrome b/b6/petB
LVSSQRAFQLRQSTDCFAGLPFQASNLLLCLAIQTISSILLAMHYNVAMMLSFGSMKHIIRDITYGSKKA